MDFDFLRQDKMEMRTQETFIGDKMEIFLIKDYVKKAGTNNPFAVEMGNKVMTMGIFWFRVNGTDWYELEMPVKFEFQFSDFYRQTMSLRPGMPQNDYNVYVLKKGDAFVWDILHRKDVDDLKKSYIEKMVENGKLPNDVPYNDSLQCFMNNLTSSDQLGIGVGSISVEFILSETYRNKRNLREPFRFVATDRNQYDYRLIDITKVPELNSTFTSMIGEDINNQLVASVLRNRENLPDDASPVEKVLKY